MKYDAEKATERILEWKAHIVRAINQEKAKIDILNNLTAEQVLVVIDWAMKWLPRSYRETQMEWFGKKGISWHVSACITKAEKEEAEFQVIYVENSILWSILKSNQILMPDEQYVLCQSV